MADDVLKFLEADIPDPTDFATDAPGLRQLDEALRCTMCRELFAAPVTVNCPHGHCFCSLCIRTAIATKDECPLCRHPILEVHLRKNPAMEDVVKAWNLARPFVLEVLREREESRAAASVQSSSKYFSEKPKSKKRRRAPSPGSDDDIIEVGEHLASPRSKAKASSSSPAVVPCPICNRTVPMGIINNHIDNGCPPPKASDLEAALPPSSKNKGKQKQEWTKLFQGGGDGAVISGPKTGKGKSRVVDQESEPLPKVAYDTVTQKRLREILDEQGLPSTGDKAAMTARHSRWVNMFNANLDASPTQQKTTKQLILELRRWEETEEKKKVRGKLDAKDFDAEQYQKEHKTAFARLIQAAKPKVPKKPASRDGSSSENPQAEGDGDTTEPSTQRTSEASVVTVIDDD